jgi:hypothetical protein
LGCPAAAALGDDAGLGGVPAQADSKRIADSIRATDLRDVRNMVTLSYLTWDACAKPQDLAHYRKK